METGLAAHFRLCLIACALPAGCAPRVAEGLAPADREPAAASSSPREVQLRGEVVCLLEEVGRRHGLPVPPVHDHLIGVRADSGDLHTLLRTSTSGLLFSDTRFRGRTLLLQGRVFPRSDLLEVTRTGWLKDGKPQEVYYWCEVCSIRTLDPGPCACCQRPVELLERPEGGGPVSRVPDLQPKTGSEPPGGRAAKKTADTRPAGAAGRTGQP
jgi:hypothetical protein